MIAVRSVALTKSAAPASARNRSATQSAVAYPKRTSARPQPAAAIATATP